MGLVVIKLTKVEDGARKNIENKRGQQPGIPQRGTQAEKTSIAQGSGEAIRHKKPAKPVVGMDPVVAMEAMSDVNRIVGGNEGYQPHTATLRVRSTFDYVALQQLRTKKK